LARPAGLEPATYGLEVGYPRLIIENHAKKQIMNNLEKLELPLKRKIEEVEILNDALDAARIIGIDLNGFKGAPCDVRRKMKEAGITPDRGPFAALV
jgi:hypothetical protein